MDLWTTWKKGFDAWEATTADFLERVMRSPALLQPSGIVLKALSATKEASDTFGAAWWRALGLPTRRDQERVLHRLNELESLLRDLEERLPAAAAGLGPRVS
jgi:hypothetical protein